MTEGRSVGHCSSPLVSEVPPLLESFPRRIEDGDGVLSSPVVCGSRGLVLAKQDK